MIEAKAKVHHLFEEATAIRRKVKSERRIRTPAESSRVKKLDRQQIEIYRAAWKLAKDAAKKPKKQGSQ